MKRSVAEKNVIWLIWFEKICSDPFFPESNACSLRLGVKINTSFIFFLVYPQDVSLDCQIWFHSLDLARKGVDSAFHSEGLTQIRFLQSFGPGGHAPCYTHYSSVLDEAQIHQFHPSRLLRMIRFHVLAYTRLNQTPCWLCLTTSLLATERIAIEGQRFSLLFSSEKLFSFVSIHLQEKRPKRLVSTSSATWRPVLSAATTTRRTNVAMTTKFATFARAVSACRVHSRRCLLVGEDGYIMDPDSLDAWWTHVPWLVKIDSISLLTKKVRDEMILSFFGTKTSSMSRRSMVS